MKYSKVVQGKFISRPNRFIAKVLFKKYQEEQLSIVKAADDEQTRFFEQYIDEMGWTEKEYLKQVSLQWQKVMTRANLYNKFFEDNPNATEEAWEKYVEKYKNMLSLGRTKDSIELLRMVDVDLENEETYRQAFKYYENSLNKLKELLK